MEDKFDYETLAYVVGVAIGDGNLSNPNGRAIRLRVTCDTRYPNLIAKISQSIKIILPNNKVSIIDRAKTYIDITCYSNQWDLWLPWKTGEGPKSEQFIRIPAWIQAERKFYLACLRGLIETDGSIYSDRGYTMVNFTTVNQAIALDFESLIKDLGFRPKIYLIKTIHKPRYTIRIARNAEEFIQLAKIDKS